MKLGEFWASGMQRPDDAPIGVALTLKGVQDKGRNTHFAAGQKDAKIIPFKRKGE